MITKNQIKKILQTIPDPELGISVWDLGLIYDMVIDQKKQSVEIIMTLTSVGCPLFDMIADPIRQKVGKLKGVKRVDINLTFDPPWTPDKMNQDAKMQLGFS